MSAEWEVKDKVVLVTGAASGLGAAMAEAFLKHGARHVAILDVSVEQGEATAARFNSSYGADRCEFLHCDVTDDTRLHSVLDDVAARRGGLHVIINNAGLMNDSASVYRKMIEVNYSALVSSTLKAMEMWRADKGGPGGTVINVASEVAVKLHHTMPIYNGTKSAVLHFSISIGMEPHYSRTKVRVMNLCPGITNTALFNNARSIVFDKATANEMFEDITDFAQKPVSVAAGVLEMYRRGESASTWLVTDDEAPRDITPDVMKRFFLGSY